MSAFMMPADRIRSLAIEIVRAKINVRDLVDVGAETCGDTATQVAEALALANGASLRERYGHRAGEMFDIGSDPIAPITAYEVLTGKPMAPGALAKLSQCFAYQACEVTNWDDSDVCKVLRRLNDHLLASLPGYAEAKWG